MTLTLLALAIALNGFAGPTDNGSYALLPYGCDDPETPAIDTDLTCYKLVVSCGASVAIGRYNDAIADVEIRERMPAIAVPVGVILFFSGEYGDQYYGRAPYSETTVATMRANGFKTYEVRWLNDDGSNFGDGWISGISGEGPKLATCGAREIIEWIKENRAVYMPLCATGNSFGGVQIAYAIAAYDAGSFLKSVVYSAGPSVTDIPRGCFDATYDNGVFSGTQSITPGFNVGNLREDLIDRLMGWTDDLNNCGTDDVHPDFTSTYNTPAAQGMALVSYGAAEPRNYAPSTWQFFVEAGLDSTGARVQGNLYYNAITGYKTQRVITAANEDVAGDSLRHTTYNTATGSRFIREYLLFPANCQ